MSSPYLPPELESIIFLLALENDHNGWKQLILVAKRVYDWLIPHVFSVVQFDEDDAQSFPINFNEENYPKFAPYARHLFINWEVMVPCLRFFPNIINPAYWVDYTSDDIQSLHNFEFLTRLSISPSEEKEPSRVLFELFAKLTHLDLIDTLHFWAESHFNALKELVYLPNLTHLCVLRGFDTAVMDLFLERDRCPNLKVVVSWGYREDEPYLADGGPYHDKGKPGVDNRFDCGRVLEVNRNRVRDWEEGARGVLDMWRFVDGVLASMRNDLLPTI